jgi:rRNA small subunit pseudouridine methyltransferase Nep1
MLHIILVDTALELIPAVLASKPAAMDNIKKFGNAGKLLDSALHHTIMKELPHSEARGRPDILHHFLLDTLGSIANLSHQLKIYFHLPQHLFYVDSEMQCPRDYLRFKGLMTQLLTLGHIPPDPPYFIHSIDSSLKKWITNKFPKDRIWKLTKTGQTTSILEKFQSIPFDQDVAVLIGGFQKGYFSSEVEEIPGIPISIYSEGLDSWVVVNRILSAFEFSHLK